jgi:hypothetical protein
MARILFANLSVLLDQGGEIGEKGSFEHPATEKAPNEGLDECVRKALKANPLFCMRKIAKALNIGFMTVRNHPAKSLRMKCYHMRWVPHMLTAAQKAKRTKMVGSMLQMLESHTASCFRFLRTGNESWMFDDYHHETM